MEISKLLFEPKLPSPARFGEHAVLVYDRKLERGFSPWIKTWPRRLGVSGGEKLKTLENFTRFAEAFHHQVAGVSKSKISVVSFGGGSVGDFAGFFASVYKRGVGLYHIPSTWLSAMDSAHGGKNALNLKGAKNQIGTFYPALRVFLIKDVLESQPSQRAREVLGEVAKMGLIDLNVRKLIEKNLTTSLWPLLPAVINAKLKIVRKDPLEKKGLRQFLNLGHTMGHVLESHSGLPHGMAVAQGLLFATTLGNDLKITSDGHHQEILDFLGAHFDIKNQGKKFSLTKSAVSKLILEDKKNLNSGKIMFVLLKKPGSPQLQEVPFPQVLKTLKRLKWLGPRA